jgi:hypothetical protein
VADVGYSRSVRRPNLDLLPQVAANGGDQVYNLGLEGATDADLRVLASLAGQFSRLRQLCLEACPEVTDEGLQSLAALTTLEELVLIGDTPRLTPAGVKAFRAKQPRCRVKGGPKPWWKFW